MVGSEASVLESLQDVERYLGRVRRRVWSLAEGVPRHLWTRRPAPDRWSVLDNLEHLVLTEQFCCDLLEKMVERAQREGRLRRGEPVRWVDARSVLLDALGKKYTAPVWAEPRGRWDDQEVAAELVASRRRLEALLRDLPRYDVERMIEPHPLYGWPLNAAQWAHFVGLHEQGHARQLSLLASQLAPPARAPGASDGP